MMQIYWNFVLCNHSISQPPMWVAGEVFLMLFEGVVVWKGRRLGWEDELD